jgi:hypothetical protein
MMTASQGTVPGDLGWLNESLHANAGNGVIEGLPLTLVILGAGHGPGSRRKLCRHSLAPDGLHARVGADDPMRPRSPDGLGL